MHTGTVRGGHEETMETRADVVPTEGGTGWIPTVGYARPNESAPLRERGGRVADGIRDASDYPTCRSPGRREAEYLR